MPYMKPPMHKGELFKAIQMSALDMCFDKEDNKSNMKTVIRAQLFKANDLVS